MTHPTDSDTNVDTEPETGEVNRYLVIVGSSAGGIEALSRLVATLPADFPAPIIIAQHLDPNHISHLGDILARRTSLTVRTIAGSEPITPGTVFVVPPDRHVSVTDHHVRLLDNDPTRPKPSIDLLFESAAPIFGEFLLAVILTGSGSDGADGARAVKDAGGTVIIQNPETAAYPSMPRSLAPSVVDVVADIDRIGPLLADLVRGMAETDETQDDPALQTVLDRVRDRRGIDFGNYKAPTIARRLRRRMATVETETLDGYLRFMDDHPEEEERLVNSFLIKVTRFFRDAALFDHLRERILPELIAAAVAAGRELRIWSAGCATGEEAYSLAILLADLLAEQDAPPNLRIFATDLDEEAVAFARRGVYPATALANLSPELIARHFIPRNGAFEISKAVRGSIVFGQHDLGQRPPFAHTDLILCRNVLIYFTTPLQERALRLFAYSLRDGGYLALGMSETPHPVNDQFVADDRRLRVFRRQGERTALPPAGDPVSVPRRRPVTPPTRVAKDLEHALRHSVEETRLARVATAESDDLVRVLPVGIVVVDRQYDIQSVNGAARELLGIHGLAVGQDFVHLARQIPSTPLRAAIDAVFRGETASDLTEIVTAESATGETRHLTLQCALGPSRETAVSEAAVVLITDVTPVVVLREASEREVVQLNDVNARLRADVERLDRERRGLAVTVERMAEANRHVLTANRELTDTVDDLLERNDELRIANASVQVAAEEIETLSEEMQATNEELETLNEETQATNEELHTANDDLQARALELRDLAATHAAEEERLTAILVSMGDAVLVVDGGGVPTRTNAAYDELLEDASFQPEDALGKPLPPAATPQMRAGRGESFQLDFTSTTGGGDRRWFEATGRPLRGDAGGVLVIRDVSERGIHRLQDQFLALASHELRTPLAALQGYIQLAQRQSGPAGDLDRLRRYLVIALEQARRQGALIDDLVDVARLQGGKLALTLTPLDLGSLARRVVDVAQVLAPPAQTITLDAGDSTLLVAGDAGRLEQVVLNLLTNAIRYAPETDRIDVRLSRQGGTAELAIQDYGPGIAAAELGRIFSRFAQIERTDRPGQGGLGLGLFIAQEIAQGHGGDITVTSTVGEGTVFTLRLPLLEDVVTS